MTRKSPRKSGRQSVALRQSHRASHYTQQLFALHDLAGVIIPREFAAIRRRLIRQANEEGFFLSIRGGLRFHFVAKRKAQKRVGKPRRLRFQPKLTPNLQEKFVSKVRDGIPVEVVCEIEGIAPTTYRNWMRWGGDRKSKPYDDFFDSVTRARADATMTLFSSIRGGDRA